MTKDKKEKERGWGGVLSAKQMMINKGAGKMPHCSKDGGLYMSLFSLITSHLLLELPQPLSSTISSQPRMACQFPLV